MLAKIHVFLPCELSLILGNEYRIYEHEEDGYQIYFDVPTKCDKPSPLKTSDKILINNKPSFQADAVTIVFKKDAFERRNESPIDPPEQLIQKTLHSFLSRLRYVAQAPQLKIPDFPDCSWILEYLNNDGSCLEQTEGLRRGIAHRKFEFTYFAIDASLWDSVFSLPNDFKTPAWHALIMDSRAALPHVGTSIVLAASALEVFIAELLDNLVRHTSIPGPLWEWVNDRGNWQKEPSVEEQFDVLLKIMTGRSLKEEGLLWEGFRNLKATRNAFVHSGVAKLGNKYVSPPDALQLIGRAEEIIKKIREWIPEDCQWPVYTHEIKVDGSNNIPIASILSGSQYSEGSS